MAASFGLRVLLCGYELQGIPLPLRGGDDGAVRVTALIPHGAESVVLVLKLLASSLRASSSHLRNSHVCRLNSTGWLRN